MKTAKIILFDFDGVIVDSFNVSFEVMKKCSGRPDFTENGYRKFFEGNIYEEMEKAGIKKSGFNRFFEEYVPRLLQLPPIEGVRKALINLSPKYNLIIISSTTSKPIQDWLEKENLLKCFSAVMGGDTHKSKIEKIRMALGKYGAGREDSVFVTDTLGDIKEASEAGIGSLAVTYGYHKEDVLRKGCPKGLIKTPGELAAEVKKYFEKRS